MHTRRACSVDARIGPLRSAPRLGKTLCVQRRGSVRLCGVDAEVRYGSFGTHGGAYRVCVAKVAADTGWGSRGVCGREICHAGAARAPRGVRAAVGRTGVADERCERPRGGAGGGPSGAHGLDGCAPVGRARAPRGCLSDARFLRLVLTFFRACGTIGVSPGEGACWPRCVCT